MLFRQSAISALVVASAATITSVHAASQYNLRKLVTTPSANEIIAPRDPMPSWPSGRFKVWDALTPAQQIDANDGLGYKEDSWNLPGTNEIEFLSFETINLTSLGMVYDDTDIVVQVGKTGPTANSPINTIVNTLNITERDVWDCHLNHYQDYDWDELIQYNVSQYLEALGWNNASWMEEEEPPPTEMMYWFELDDNQTIAAEAICYTAELWTYVGIPQWPGQTLSNNNDGATTAANANANNNVTVTHDDAERITVNPWDLPVIRFTPWDDLTVAQRGYATTIGYNETDWNSPGTGIIEGYPTRYEDLTVAQTTAYSQLGIDEFYYDCLIQHYNSYNWNELPEAGVQGYLMTLGWTLSSWHGVTAPPPTDSSPYAALTTQQKAAADQLCYLPETYEYGSQLSDINLNRLTAPPQEEPSPPQNAAVNKNLWW